MSRTRFIEHDGVRICHLDFTNIADERVAIEAIAAAKRIITAEPKASVRTLTDVTGSRVTNTIREALNDLTAANKPHVTVGAVVGVTGVQRVILRAITHFQGRRLEMFDSVDQAKAWLAKQP